MNNKNNAVIIDTNFIFYRYAYRLGKNVNYLMSIEDKIEFLNHICEELEKTISQFPDIKKVIFVRDYGKSWRYFISNEIDYKGKRSRNYTFSIMDFDYCIGKFFEILESKNVLCFQLSSVEGDDWIYYISQILYNNNNSSIIITEDSDMKQLLKSNEYFEKFVCIHDNLKNKTYTDKRITEREQEFNGIFDGMSILNTIEKSYEILNVNEILFKKIISGDSSDFIPSVYKYQKGTQFVNFTELRVEQYLLQNLETFTDDYFEKLYTYIEFRKELAIRIFSYIKKEIQKLETFEIEIEEINKISDNIFINMKYIWLNQMIYDKKLKNSILKVIINKLEVKDEIINFKEVLIGTEFEQKNKSDSIHYLKY